MDADLDAHEIDNGEFESAYSALYSAPHISPMMKDDTDQPMKDDTDQDLSSVDSEGEEGDLTQEYNTVMEHTHQSNSSASAQGESQGKISSPKQYHVEVIETTVGERELIEGTGLDFINQHSDWSSTVGIKSESDTANSSDISKEDTTSKKRHIGYPTDINTHSSVSGVNINFENREHQQRSKSAKGTKDNYRMPSTGCDDIIKVLSVNNNDIIQSNNDISKPNHDSLILKDESNHDSLIANHASHHDSEFLPSQSTHAIKSNNDTTKPRERLTSNSSADIPSTYLAGPVRARSRVWSSLSQSHDSPVFLDSENARSKFKCQSHFSPKKKRRAKHSRPATDGEDLSPSTPLLMPSSHLDPGTSGTHTMTTEVPDVIFDDDVLQSSADSLATRDGMTESDSHCHTNRRKDSLDKKARTKLIIASVLCLVFMVGESVGGVMAHSLAIISDAAHLLTDFASFMISLVALYLANRPATQRLSFGWYRAEILGALVSILMLWVLTGILVYSAVIRIIDDDYEINATVMLITAATGVAFNVLLGTTLHQHTHSHGGGGGHGHAHGGEGHAHGGHGGEGHKGHGHAHGGAKASGPVSSYGSVGVDLEQGAHQHKDTKQLVPAAEKHDVNEHNRESNINVKAAFIHVIGDLLQSIGVLVAALIIYFKPEWKIADPICTFLFSLFVLVTTMTIMRDILVVLMEGTPRGINFAEVRNTFFEVEGVLDIHNLRVWSLTMDKVALSVHLAIDKSVSDPHKVLKMASQAIQKKFNISETTMQIEEYVTDMDDCTDCQGPKLT